MKPIASSAALVALAACTSISAQTVPVEPTAYRCTTVPWLEAGKPLVRASVNGRELTFLVDTGAEYDGWIKPEIAQELGMPVVGSVPSEGEDDPTGGVPFYGAASFTLGAITFSDRRLGEMPEIGPKGQMFDGIIGNGLFADMQAAFDYERGVLQATDLKLDKGSTVPFDKYGIPVLTLDIGGVPAEVHLDTGNLASRLFVTAETAGKLAIVGEPEVKGRAMTVSGAFEVIEGRIAGAVRYGDTTLPITAVRWPGAYDSGQLGSQGLAGQTVRVDWRNRRVSIMPEADAPTCD